MRGVDDDDRVSTRFAAGLGRVTPTARRLALRAGSDWQTIFNGRNLDGWVVKLAHHELGDNYADTFRVENGVIRVMYDKYGDFGARFGHLFYKQKLSHYVLALEYRLLRRAGEGRPELRAAEQRRDGALAGARDDPEGSGLADLGRGAVPGRRPDDDERLHAGHGDLHEGRDGEGALHQLHVEDLRQRRLGGGGGRGPRLGARAPPHRRPDRAASTRSR